MYYTLKQKIYGHNEEIDMATFDQSKYSRSSAKSRRTVICRISVHQNPNRDENQLDVNQDKIDDDHELTNLRHCSKRNEIPNTVTYL